MWNHNKQPRHAVNIKNFNSINSKRPRPPILISQLFSHHCFNSWLQLLQHVRYCGQLRFHVYFRNIYNPVTIVVVDKIDFTVILMVFLKDEHYREKEVKQACTLSSYSQSKCCLCSWCWPVFLFKLSFVYNYVFITQYWYKPLCKRLSLYLNLSCIFDFVTPASKQHMHAHNQLQT